MRERRIGIIVDGATGRMTRNQHLKHALVSLRDDGGKPVHCEEPIATTSAEARELAELADGGAMMLDTMPHFRCRLEDLVAPVERTVCRDGNRIARRWVNVPVSGASS